MLMNYALIDAKKFLSKLPKELYIFIVFTSMHFISPHLYVEYCTPASWNGFILSPFMVITPQCQLLRWSIGFSGYVLNHIWVLIASFILKQIVLFIRPMKA